MGKYDQTKPINTQFFILTKEGTTRYASRSLYTIPRFGEEVRFQNTIYTVVKVIHFYDEPELRIGVIITQDYSSDSLLNLLEKTDG